MRKPIKNALPNSFKKNFIPKIYILFTAFRLYLLCPFFAIGWVKFTRWFKGSEKIYGALNVFAIRLHGLSKIFGATHIPFGFGQNNPRIVGRQCQRFVVKFRSFRGIGHSILLAVKNNPGRI